MHKISATPLAYSPTIQPIPAVPALPCIELNKIAAIIAMRLFSFCVLACLKNGMGWKFEKLTAESIFEEIIEFSALVKAKVDRIFYVLHFSRCTDLICFGAFGPIMAPLWPDMAPLGRRWSPPRWCRYSFSMVPILGSSSSTWCIFRVDLVPISILSAVS